MAQVAYAVIWWLIPVAIGLIAFPLTSRICSRLPDRGYSISKIVGLLFVTYFSFLLASAHLVKFGYINISISLVLLLALSFFLGRKNLSPKNMPLKPMLVSEGLFLVAYVLFSVYLLHKPDIFFSFTEDFMDFAFLNSILRSDYFPPLDPWLAGYSLPYYYGGQLLVGILTLISRVPPAISYNLAMAMFFGLLACASYGLGYNLTRRKLYGFVAVIFICIVGYSTGLFQLFAFIFNHEVLGYSPPGAQNFIDWLLHFDVAPGIIPGAATKYPYSAFLQGELHAHTVTLPFQLMYITLLFTLFKGTEHGGRPAKVDLLLSVFVLGISLGFFWLINTWDYPLYLALTVLAFMLLNINIGIKGLAGIIALSLLLYEPHYISSLGGVQGIGVVHGRTDLADFVEIFALFLFAVVSLLYVSCTGKWFRGKRVILIGVLAIVVASVAFLLDFQLILVLIPLLLVSLYCIFKAKTGGETEFVLLLVFTGALVALFCEVFFIDDALGGSAERYNTVMKLYLPVWILFGIASAYGVFRVMATAGGRLKAFWTVMLVVLVLVCTIQPVGETIGWASGKRTYFGINRGTLDGMAYVETLAPNDYEAIKWINRNIEGQPVMLEAPGAAYQFTSHVSAMTGLPTVIGWLTHEVMWRNSWDVVSGRDTDVDTIYQTTDNEEAFSLLGKYDVEYIYIGDLEREKYGEEGLKKFAAYPDIYTLVYENRGAEIYQVMR
jgi:YYY domain-containing protein